MSFADTLKRLRQEAGMTKTDLAAKAGLHRMGLVKLERGERQPSWETVQALAKALGVTCSAFEEQPPKRGKK